MNSHIRDVESMVVVKLGETEMTVGDLVTLEIGDVIPLKQEASGEVDLAVEGIEKMKAVVGEYKGNRAVQISEIIK